MEPQEESEKGSREPSLALMRRLRSGADRRARELFRSVVAQGSNRASGDVQTVAQVAEQNARLRMEAERAARISRELQTSSSSSPSPASMSVGNVAPFGSKSDRFAKGEVHNDALDGVVENELGQVMRVFVEGRDESPSPAFYRPRKTAVERSVPSAVFGSAPAREGVKHAAQSGPANIEGWQQQAPLHSTTEGDEQNQQALHHHQDTTRPRVSHAVSAPFKSSVPRSGMIGSVPGNPGIGADSPGCLAYDPSDDCIAPRRGAGAIPMGPKAVDQAKKTSKGGAAKGSSSVSPRTRLRKQEMERAARRLSVQSNRFREDRITYVYVYIH